MTGFGHYFLNFFRGWTRARGMLALVLTLGVYFHLGAAPGGGPGAGNTGNNNPGGYTGPAGGTSGGELPGFAESSWETSYDDVRKTLKDLALSGSSADKVEIQYMQEDRYIRIRRNEVGYVYRFYKKPQDIINYKASLEPAGAQDPHPEYKVARLYYVGMMLPLMNSAEVFKVLQAKYGNPSQKIFEKATDEEEEKPGASVANPVTGEKGNGVYIWELKGGMVFQWQQKYSDGTYTRRVDYISDKVREELKEDFPLFFTVKQKQILKNAKL